MWLVRRKLYGLIFFVLVLVFCVRYIVQTIVYNVPYIVRGCAVHGLVCNCTVYAFAVQVFGTCSFVVQYKRVCTSYTVRPIWCGVLLCSLTPQMVLFSRTLEHVQVCTGVPYKNAQLLTSC